MYPRYLLPCYKNQLLNEVLSQAKEAVETIKREDEKEYINIVDAMEVVNAVCKGKDKIETCADIKKSFLKKISKKLEKYQQGRIAFDEYKEGSLKDQTRAKRLGDVKAIEFDVTDETHLKVIGMNVFLSHVKTKAKLVTYLGSALVEEYEHSNYPLIVVYNETVYTNSAAEKYTSLSTHSHEEADTLIPLLLKDIADTHP